MATAFLWNHLLQLKLHKFTRRAHYLNITKHVAVVGNSHLKRKRELQTINETHLGLWLVGFSLKKLLSQLFAQLEIHRLNARECSKRLFRNVLAGSCEKPASEGGLTSHKALRWGAEKAIFFFEKHQHAYWVPLEATNCFLHIAKIYHRLKGNGFSFFFFFLRILS